jgi:hypothetical protein
MPIVLVDNDANLNSRVDEDLDVFNPDVPIIPALSTGNPLTLGAGGVEPGTASSAFLNSTVTMSDAADGTNAIKDIALIIRGSALGSFSADVSVNKFSDRAILNPDTLSDINATALVYDYGIGVTADDLQKSISPTAGSGIADSDRLLGFNLFNQDLKA